MWRRGYSYVSWGLHLYTEHEPHSVTIPIGLLSLFRRLTVSSRTRSNAKKHKIQNIQNFRRYNMERQMTLEFLKYIFFR